MKMRSHTPLILLLATLFAISLSCDRGDSSRDALEFLRRTEATQYEGEEIPRKRVQELQADIKEYEDDVAEVVRKLSQVATFRKLLAEEFIDQEMYGPALENLQAAMELQPANAVLFYLAGVSSAQTGKAFIADQQAREEYLRQAEQYYLRALELDARYRECLYGLAVLYLFELGEPAQALGQVNTLLEIDPENVNARFLKARALVETGRVDEAAELYGEIAEDANSRAQRSRALENRRQLLEGGGS